MPLPPKGVDLPVAAPSPKTPFVRAAPDVPEATYLPPAAQATPVYKADRWLAGIVLLCVVVGAGFYGVRYYLKRPQTPAPVSSTAADTSASSAPSSLPGKAIAQTRDAAAVHDAIAQDVDRVIDEAAGDANATSSENLAATARADLPPPEPTEEFRNFVTSLKVSGVFQGEPSRALLNGKMYGVGQIVDETLGISFAGVEPESKNLVFKDSDGAVVKRRY